jgi:hypothetical protein
MPYSTCTQFCCLIIHSGTTILSWFPVLIF